MKKLSVTTTKQDYVILTVLLSSHTHQNITWGGVFLATCEEQHLVYKKNLSRNMINVCVTVIIYIYELSYFKTYYVITKKERGSAVFCRLFRSSKYVHVL